LRLRGEPLRLPRRDFAGVGMGGVLLFVAGNGLITAAEKTVPSGMTAVLAATTPLWMALFELLWPHGDRLTLRGWLGMILGLGGVLLLLAEQLGDPSTFLNDIGPLLVLGSACSWAFGSLLLRYRRLNGSHLTGAAYQMLIGGGRLAFLGVLLGETRQLTPDKLTPGAAFAFFYLLIVSSLVGFVAFNWLLGHVSATQVSTYAYVNPVVAVLIGTLLDHEELTGWIVGGIVVILSGVALVRSGGGKESEQPPTLEKPPAPPFFSPHPKLSLPACPPAPFPPEGPG